MIRAGRLASSGGTLALVFAAALAVPALGADPSPATGSFSPAGSLAEDRMMHSATLLPDGRVLVIGGQGWSGDWHVQLASVELWDEATQTFTGTGPLVEARSGHTATLLLDGRVLVVGGPGSEGILAPAELRDPVTGVFTEIVSLSRVGTGHTATLLRDGRVLLVGGIPFAIGDAAAASDPASAELWDPVTDAVSPAGVLGEARARHTATLLPDGRVLVIGGESLVDGAYTALGSAELWDADTGTFTPAGSLAEARINHTATLLPDGRVLVVGGGGSSGWIAAAEIWDPATGAFAQSGPLLVARWLHTATPLPDGRVLVVGGNGDSGDPVNPAQLALAEVWDPATGAFGPAGSLHQARESHTATLLPDGRVLVVGGYGSDGALASAELWAP